MSESLRKKLTFLAKYSYVFILLLIFLIMSFATDKFLTVDNLLNVARQSSMLLIMALGMTMAMLLGRGVDMSLGAIVSISSCFAAGSSSKAAVGNPFCWASWWALPSARWQVW